jgi:subtilisin family serine protease
MTAELQDRYVRPRRSIFLVAATSFALAFTTLGIAPAGANQQNASSSITSNEAEISRLLVSYEPGVAPVNVSGDVAGQNYVPNVELTDVERVGRNLFTVDLPDAVSESEAIKIADELEKSPQVAIVEPDFPISLSVTDPRNPQNTNTNRLWGLDRIDQRSATLNGTYKFDSTGQNVNAYVIDTGIYPHNEFQDRLELGYNAVSDREDTPSQRFSTDCSTNGHGTHVAGILGGTTYGVAKDVSLIPIRVFGCNGDAYNSDVIYGIIWAIDHHKAGELAVANMSLGGNKSVILDGWVQALINDGVHVVVASGNSNVDACNSSPASTPGTITVNSAGHSTVNSAGPSDNSAGPSDNSAGPSDVRSSFSNFGACTDIFAPGEAILSAGNFGPNSTRTLQGTSMASPFVAGAVAKILQTNPTFNRNEVIAQLLDSATPFVSNKLRDPSRLLYSPAADVRQQELDDADTQAQIYAVATEAVRVQDELEAAEAARIAAEQAAAAEAARIEAERIAAEKAAADKAAADKLATDKAAADKLATDKAAADKLAADQAAAAEAARIAASLPVVRKSLAVRALNKKRISVSVAAPSGSKTFVQRKVGKKWRNVVSITAVPSMVVKVSRAGTYRVRIVIPTGTITSKTVRVK